MAANQKFKSELSATDTKILIIVLILIVAFIVGIAEYFLLFKEYDKDNNDIQTKITSLQPQLKEAEAVPGKIATIQKQIDALMGKTNNEDDKQTEEGLNEILDVPTILAIVESSASSAGVDLSSITMDGNAAYIKGGIIAGMNPGNAENGGTQVQPSGDFAKLGIALVVNKVTYEGLMDFLANLEEAGYYLTTVKTNLKAIDSSPGSYSGNINFSIYSYNTSKKAVN